MDCLRKQIVHDPIEHLNKLARDAAKDQVPMRTTAELIQFFKNPPKRTYSVPLEDAMTSVVTMFRTADDNSRRQMVSSLTQDARNGFLGYAAAMANLAIREQSPSLIEQGLIAIVIEGGKLDWRDSLVALAKLYHSAVKLGMDAQNAFERAASLELAGFLNSPDKARLLSFQLE
jgi:hypothetical protein